MTLENVTKKEFPYKFDTGVVYFVWKKVEGTTEIESQHCRFKNENKFTV